MKTNNKPDLANESFLNEVSSSLTFETFIEGDCNRDARLAGLSLIEDSGNKLKNPFIIYSEGCWGKTHLAQAIFNEIFNKKPSKKSLFVNCETFCRQYVRSIRENKTDDFYTYYLQSDVLIIDDIICLEGKNQTQKSLLKLFDQMVLNNKQIILTSRILPKELLKFEKRFISRLRSGLTVCLLQPDYKTRVEILRNNVKTLNMNFPENIIMHIAKRVDSGIREMQGASICIAGYAISSKQEISIELADRIIEKL